MEREARFELKTVGRIFRIMAGKGVPGGDHGRYQMRCSDVLAGTSVSYSANLDEMRQLHRWLTHELAYRTGAIRRRPYV